MFQHMIDQLSRWPGMGDRPTLCGAWSWEFMPTEPVETALTKFDAGRTYQMTSRIDCSLEKMWTESRR